MPKKNISPNHYPILSDFLSYLVRFKHRSTQTVLAYERDLRRYFSFLNQDVIAWHTIDRQSCRDYVAHLTTHEQLSGRSMGRHISCLRSFWNYLIYQGLCSDNVWKFIRLPKYDKKLPAYLDALDIHRVLDQMPFIKPVDYRDKLIIELLFVSGMRVSELVAVKLDQIDLAGQEILVLGKGQKYRYVFFGSDTAQLIQLYLDQMRAMCPSVHHDHLIINQKGGPMTTRSVQRLLAKTGQHYQLPVTLTPHVLRHSFASALYKNGADLKVIQDLLGHEHITTTQVYTHISFSQLKLVYQKAHPRASLIEKESVS